MTTSIKLLVSIAGGGYTSGAVAAAFGQTMALQAQSTANFSSIRYEIYEFPPGMTQPAGWSTDATTGAYFFAPANVTTAPPTVTLPASGALNWGWVMLRLRGNVNPLRLNTDGSPNTGYNPALTDEATCVNLPSPTLGMQGVGFGLTTQADAMRAWVGPLMQSLRVADNASSGASFSAGGDLGGTGISQIVQRVHGATVPAAGALVTGSVLQATGASALGYGAVNLALSAAVTGILAVANGGTGLAAGGANGTVLTMVSGSPAWSASGAGFTAGGDLGGSSSSQNVLKANGATIPVAGALTTGNSLFVTGASTLSYGPLNLAGGAGYVSGVLPAANQASQTLGGDLSGTSGAAVVAKVNGATVPAGGALTIGAVLQASAAGALSYGPISLSNPASVGGSLAVTNGGTGLAAYGLADQLLGMNHAATALAYFTASQDVTLASGAFTVVGLQGRAVAATAPTNGQVYQWVSGSSQWQPMTPAGAGSVTGSGFWHSTSATLDGAASKGTAGQIAFTNAAATDIAWASLSQDVSASTSTPGQLTVTGIQNHGVASTAPSTGQFFIQGGSTWGPVSLSGDVAASNTVAGLTAVLKINGATVPGAGALTTGNGLYVSGISSLSYSALNLAGGANWVSGVLPSANQASQTLGGDLAGSTASAVVVGLTGTTGTISIVATALTATQANAGLTIGQAQQANGSAPVNMTLAPQAPGSGASTTANGTPASLVLALPAPVSTGLAAAFSITQPGLANSCFLGPVSGGGSSWALWLGATVATNASFTVQSDGSNTRIQASTNVIINFAGSQRHIFTTNGLQVGSGATAFGGGVNVLGLSNATTVPASNPSGGGALFASSGSMVWRASGGLQFSTMALVQTTTYTIDSGTTPDGTIFADTSGGAWSLTLPPPTAGRMLRVVDQKGNFGTNNLTLVRSSTEQINGIAASRVLSAAWGVYTIVSDGTNWMVS